MAGEYVFDYCKKIFTIPLYMCYSNKKHIFYINRSVSTIFIFYVSENPCFDSN